MGSTQVIDDNGDAGGNWTVVAFQYKNKKAGTSSSLIKGHMMPVAHFCSLDPLDCEEKTSICLPVSLSFYPKNCWSEIDHVFFNPSLLFVDFDRN